jgi:uncharacterized protein (DUF2147 family)
MKRIACLVALMALSSPACARGYSFTFHGHRVHIASHCRSLSCVSVSGLGNRRDRDNDVATTNDPAPAPAPAQVPAPAAPPPQAQPAPAQPLPTPARTPLVTAQIPAPVITRAQTIPAPVRSAPPPPSARTAPVAAPTLASAPPAPPSVGFDTQKPQQPAVAEKPPAKPATAPLAAPAVRVSHETESAAVDTPLGDWQTDGKNGDRVHIEACGAALCGYALDPSTGAKGEPVLVNMKPKNDIKNDTKWTGNVYSRTSGNSYYGTMTLKRDRDTLRVEACALGQFFCSGNTWTRVIGKGDELVSSQHAKPEPRS